MFLVSNYSMDVKFKNVTRTFQNLYKQIQDLLYQLKLE